MRARWVGLGQLAGVVVFAWATGCSSILGDFSVSDGGGPKKDGGGGKPDGSHMDSGHKDSRPPQDTSTHDVETPDVVETGPTCTMTVCGSKCVDTSSDGKNCGSCGHGCLGATCTSSICDRITMADSSNGVMNVVDADTDGTVVAWADVGDNSLDQVSTPGGAKMILVPAGSAKSVGAVAIGDGLAAFTTSNPGSWNTATLGVASSLVTQSTFGSTVFPTGLMWDPAGNSVFFLSSVNTFGPPYSYPYYDLTSCMPASACYAHDSTHNGYPYPILGADVAVNSSGVIFGDQLASTVTILEPPYYTPPTVIPTAFNPNHTAADSKRFYFSAQSTGFDIYSVDVGSTTVNTVLKSEPAGLIGPMASDGKHLYYIDGNGLLKYAPVGGGAFTILDSADHFKSVKFTGGALVYFTSTVIYLRAPL